jgi:hypothetical protein
MATFACWSGVIAVGLAFSVGIGHLICSRFIEALYQKNGISPQSKELKRVPNWLIGLVERLFFTCLAAAVFFQSELRIGDLITPAFIWIGLKMATHWQSAMAVPNDEEAKIGLPSARAMSAILTGLLSMVIAGFSGYFITVVAGILCMKCS